MVLQRWDPFREMRRMEEAIGRVWRGLGPGLEEHEGWGIPLDVADEASHIVVHASLPGVKPANISVSIDDDILTIRGENTAEQEEQGTTYLMRERRSGSFYRSLRLPESVNAEQTSSSYESGILTITIPKMEAKKPRQITVQVKDSSA